MPESRASRRLVKSPPELWAEISDERALARRLEALGEIRITRLEPETAVAWEGDSVRGTVALEPSGWGTKVTLTAQADTQPCAEVPTEPEPEPQSAPDPRPHAPAAEPAPDPRPHTTAPQSAPHPRAHATAAESAPDPRPHTTAAEPDADPQTLTDPEAPLELPVRPAPAAPEPDEPDPLPPAARRSRFAFLRRLLGRRRQTSASATVDSLADDVPAPKEVAPPAASQVARAEPPEIEPTVTAAKKQAAGPSGDDEAPTPAAGEDTTHADEATEAPPTPAAGEAEASAPAAGEHAAPADETAATPADEAAEASAPAVPDPAVPNDGALDLRVLDERHVAQILTGVLDDLGAAHHRPFSRG